MTPRIVGLSLKHLVNWTKREDVMVPLRMVSVKNEPYQAYVFRCIACYLLNLHKRYDAVAYKVHTLSVSVMSIFLRYIFGEPQLIEIFNL